MSDLNQQILGNLVEKLARDLAVDTAKRIIRDLDDTLEAVLKEKGIPLDLPDNAKTSIKVKALPIAIMALQHQEGINSVAYVEDEEHFVACGLVDMNGDKESAEGTRQVISRLVKMRDEGAEAAREQCNCPKCQERRDKESEPSINETTAAEILKEIEEESANV